MTDPLPAATPQLEVVGLEKVYGELRAVSGLTFEVRPGEIVGLLPVVFVIYEKKSHNQQRKRPLENML